MYLPISEFVVLLLYEVPLSRISVLTSLFYCLVFYFVVI